MVKSVSNCCFQLPSENHNGQCRKTKSSLTKRTGAAPAKFLGAALTSSRSRLLYRYHLATLTFVCRFVWTHLRVLQSTTDQLVLGWPASSPVGFRRLVLHLPLYRPLPSIFFHYINITFSPNPTFLKLQKRI